MLRSTTKLVFERTDSDGVQTITQICHWVNDGGTRPELECLVMTMARLLLAIESLGCHVPVPGEKIQSAWEDIIGTEWRYWDAPAAKEAP